MEMNKESRPKRLLVIAGSDPMAGAGLQADLKTASAIGIYAVTVVTAVTSQNTKGVQNILPVSKEHIQSQLMSIAEDVEFDAIKIGMIGSEESANVIVDFLKMVNKPVVLDPVLFAQSGGILSAINVVERLFPYCTLLTPNVIEAEAFTNVKIKNLDDMVKAAKILGKKCDRVIVKGGDIDIDFDVYIENGKIETFPIKRVLTKNTHGTGCSLASAIASFYLLGFKWRDAVIKARHLIRRALLAGVPLGERFGTIDQFVEMKEQAFRYDVLIKLNEAYEMLKGKGIGKLIPEIQSNLVFALPFAEKYLDVAGFPGRIIRIGDDILAPVSPVFGGSKHIASVVLAAKKFYPQINSAMAIKFEKKVIKKLEKKGFHVSSFDRKNEPTKIKDKEGSTLDWGVTEAFKKSICPLDIVYDEGDVGKEPVMRVFGKDPFDVVDKVMKIKEDWE